MSDGGAEAEARALAGESPLGSSASEAARESTTGLTPGDLQHEMELHCGVLMSAVAEMVRLRSELASSQARVAELEGALDTIASQRDEEIAARTAGMPKHKLKNLRVLSLLQLPRDIARAALTPSGDER